MPTFSWGDGAAELWFVAPHDSPVQVSWAPPSSEGPTVPEREIPPGAVPSSTDPRTGTTVGRHHSRDTTPPRSMVEILAAGRGRALTNIRLDRGALSEQLRHVSHQVLDGATRPGADTTGAGDPAGAQTLVVVQRTEDDHVEVRMTFTRWIGNAAVRVATTVHNLGEEPLALQAVSSLALTGIAPALGPLGQARLWTAANEWCGESRWTSQPLVGQDGLIDINAAAHGQAGRGRVERTSTSTWSSGIHVPVAALTSGATGPALVWQMEVAGPWHWELNAQSRDTDWLTLALSGPTDLQHGWATTLRPGEEFTTVPVSLAFSVTSFEDAMAQMTAHRRHSHASGAAGVATSSSDTVVRGVARADADGPLIFNDYMNALMGDPTTENEIPLIDAAAAAGAQYYCIDCGWYDDTDDWWPSIGEWKPSTVRFGDRGLTGLLQHIRDQGMVPGLWIEPEAVGVDSPAASFLPEECFMHRLGRRITEHQRHLLDLRVPATREYLNGVFDRLITGYGARYFKWDYNVTPGSGPDSDASGPGEGLLDHVRAHIAWIDELRAAHPDVIFEACSSGAQRADQSILQRFDLQSTSDEQDYRRYPAIAANAPMAMAPEMAGNWAYPHGGMTLEQVAFTLVTGLSGRLYLSGHLNTLSHEQMDLVTEAAGIYRRIIDHQRVSMPAWPLGLARWDAPIVALATIDPRNGEALVFVWNRAPMSVSIDLPLPALRGVAAEASILFPDALPAWGLTWMPMSSTLSVDFRGTGESARVIHLVPRR